MKISKFLKLETYQMIFWIVFVFYYMYALIQFFLKTLTFAFDYSPFEILAVANLINFGEVTQFIFRKFITSDGLQIAEDLPNKW